MKGLFGVGMVMFHHMDMILVKKLLAIDLKLMADHASLET